VASINADPATLLAIFAGIAAAAVTRRRDLALPIAGVLLYLVYVVRIGGDFMLGRFFAAPLLVSVAVLARALPLALGPAAATAAAVLAFAHVTMRTPTLSSDAAYDNPQFSRYHVSDERWYYWKTNGFLLSFRRNMPTHGWAEEGKKIAPDAVVPAAGGGMKGFFAPRTAFLVDNAALSEPLLARLPAIERKDWLIGHLRRALPDGYIDTLRSGRNQLRDRALARYYDELALVTRAPLFDAARWRAIWRLNTGALDHLIDVERYRAGVVTRAAEEIAGPVEEGARWDSPGAVILVMDMALEVPVGATHATAIEVVADANDTYDVELRRGGEVVGGVVVPTAQRGGLRRRLVRVPWDAAQRGYDAIRIGPREGDGMFSVAEVRLSKL
jgi:arabinofuranosyltransferase